MKKENFSEIEVKQNLINSFEEVKEIVKKYEGRSRAGLMLNVFFHVRI